MRIPWIFFIGLFFLSSCALPPKPAPVQPPATDPLIGKILDTRTGEFIPFTTLMDEIKAQDVVYLAEKHDNPMHHAIQQRIIKELVQSEAAPALGFEFFSIYDTSALMGFVAAGSMPHPKMAKKKPPTDSASSHGAAFQKKQEDRLRRQLDWDGQSDEMWAFYYDLLKLARKHHLPTAGLDLNSGQKKRILRNGIQALRPMEREYIFSSQYENPAYQARMKEIFKAVHCGMGREKTLERQYQTWLARNDTMARSITQLAGERRQGPVVVIVGGGHVEYDLGIVERVKAMDPQLKQMVVGLTEVARKPLPEADYLAPLELEGFEPVMPAPVLWFTQRVSNEDPCEKFKEMLKRMKEAPDSKPGKSAKPASN